MRELLWSEPEGWPDDASPDRLIGDWHLYQRKGGHRTSTDDLVTAWYASHRNPTGVARYLDLGCGIGSVMLMVSHKLGPPMVCGIEAQAQSFAMAQRSVSELRTPSSEFSLLHSDFRDVDFSHDFGDDFGDNELGSMQFDLITASPPYFPLGTGVLPDDTQRRACRFEARGGVEAYLDAASRALSPRGRLYLVFQSAGSERVLKSAHATRFHLTGRADFRMRSDRSDPFLSVYEFSLSPVAKAHAFSCAVRNGRGEITDQYNDIRRELGVG